MKIFITGSTGFVGKNLVKFYENHIVFEHTRHLNLTESLNYFQPEVIINCAAEIYQPENMWEPNVMWVHECLEYVKAHPTVKMVQIGSSAEYGPMARPSNEKDRINPVDMYQATKGASTLLCQGYARQYDLNICVARPYSVFGPGEQPHRLYPRLYKAFVKNEAMTLFQGFHDFIYIDDFVRGIDILVNQGKKGDIVNFGSGTQISNFDVVDLFKTIVGHDAPIDIQTHMAKSYESEIWICDTEYAKKEYGFQTEYTVEAGIRKFLEIAQY